MENEINNEINLTNSFPSNIDLLKNNTTENNLIENINKNEKNLIKKNKFRSKSNLYKIISNIDLEINYNLFITNEIIKSHKLKKYNSAIRRTHNYNFEEFDKLNDENINNNKKKKNVNKKSVKFNDPFVNEVLIESFKNYNQSFIENINNKKKCPCNFKCKIF
jgi:hypothetical protein